MTIPVAPDSSSETRQAAAPHDVRAGFFRSRTTTTFPVRRDSARCPIWHWVQKLP